MAENRGDVIRGVIIMSLVLTVIVIPLRIYTRTFVRKGFGWDDVFAVIAFCTNTALCAWAMHGTYYGSGQHIAVLKPSDAAVALKSYFMGELLYVLTTCFVKISFCLMLLRVTEKKHLVWSVYFVAAATVIFSTFYFFFILFSCSPVEFFWTKALGVTAGHCRDPVAMTKATYAHGAVMVFGDISLAMLPIILVRDLRLSRKQKTSVIGLLALGSIASVATIARIPLVHHLADPDFTWENVDIAIWSIVEVCIAIVATGLATLRPLLTEMGLMTSTMGSSLGRSNDNRSQHYHMGALSKGGSTDRHVNEEEVLYDQYHAGADRTGTIPAQSRPFSMGFGPRDAVKVPSIAS